MVCEPHVWYADIVSAHERATHPRDDLVVRVLFPPEPVRHGFLTSTSRKFSGTPYISSAVSRRWLSESTRAKGEYACARFALYPYPPAARLIPAFLPPAPCGPCIPPAPGPNAVECEANARCVPPLGMPGMPGPIWCAPSPLLGKPDPPEDPASGPNESPRDGWPGRRCPCPCPCGGDLLGGGGAAAAAACEA